MTEHAHPRPRQVTTAGVMGVTGSVLVILSLFDTLGSLRTVEVRERVDAYLSSAQGRGLGVSTEREGEAAAIAPNTSASSSSSATRAPASASRSPPGCWWSGCGSSPASYPACWSA